MRSSVVAALVTALLAGGVCSAADESCEVTCDQVLGESGCSPDSLFSCSGEKSPWSFSLTQTVDYGTNLALPIGLTPANTLIGPLAGGGPIGILGNALADPLGLLDNLGILPGAIPDVPVRGVFEDDFQFQTRGTVGYQKQVSEKGILSAGYTYYQSLHPELYQLDLYQHQITTQYAYSLSDEWTAAVNYEFDYYFLQTDSFVAQNQTGVSLGYRPSQDWYFEGNLRYGFYDFFQSSFLTSNNLSGTIKATRFLGQNRQSYVNAGYTMAGSDAELSGFSYFANSVFLGGRWAIDTEAKYKLDSTFTYANYGFDGPDPIQTNVFRVDNICTWNITLLHQLSDRWVVFGGFTLLGSDSNVARQQYTSTLVSIGATYAR